MKTESFAPAASPVKRRHYSYRQSAEWAASILFPNGQRKTRLFSVAVYGEKKAEQMAEAAYAQLVAERDAMRQNHNPSKDKQSFSEKLVEHPNKVLDFVTKQLALKNDVALSRALGIAPPVICNIRRGSLPLGASVIVRMLLTTALHIRELHQYAMEHVAENKSKANEVGYDPNNLIETLFDKLQLKTDRALALALCMASCDVSNIRQFRVPVSAPLLAKMVEKSGLSLQELIDLMGGKEAVQQFRDDFNAKNKKRLCAQHRGNVATKAGSIVTRNKATQWICHRCQKKSKRQANNN